MSIPPLPRRPSQLIDQPVPVRARYAHEVITLHGNDQIHKRLVSNVPASPNPPHLGDPGEPPGVQEVPRGV